MSNYLTLEDLKNKYLAMDVNTKLSYGIGEPMSWRGVYSEVAFPIVKNTTAGECMKMVDKALNDTFEAWKGGEYQYDLFTEVHFEQGEGCYSDLGYTRDIIEEITGNMEEESLQHKLINLM